MMRGWTTQLPNIGALQIDARFIDAQIALASALFAKGELEEAKAHYLEATRPRPEACPAS
jgi:hypothetical protein